MNTLNLKPGQLTLADLRAAYQAPVQLTLDASAHKAIDASVACVIVCVCVCVCVCGRGGV